MSGIIGHIEYEFLPRTVIPKPQTDGELRVMGYENKFPAAVRAMRGGLL